MLNKELIDWIMKGDISLEYLAKRDLLDFNDLSLKKEIGRQGWAKYILSKQEDNGHWGQGFYQPKWTSSHYTLLDLRNLEIETRKEIWDSIHMLLKTVRGPENEICENKSNSKGDLCVNGMFLNYAAYFGIHEEDLKPIIDYIIKYKMEDGGFNCRITRSGAKHSSLHTSICILEGFLTYISMGYTYRSKEIEALMASCEEFLLKHKLYCSHRTGEIIHPQMTKLIYPSRWKHDVLRGLDYFVMANRPYDHRLDDAFELLMTKRRKDGTWPMQGKHPGQTHLTMEKSGPSRINTFRVLRALKWAKKTLK
jgi:hypothetical protein